MTNSLVEKLSDWSAILVIAAGVLAWWFARDDAHRKKVALERYQEQSRLQMKGLEVALEAERNRGLELVKAVSPRSLRITESTKQAMREFAGVNASIQHLPDIECTNTAAQIRSLLTESGWKSEDPKPMPLSATILQDVVVYVKMFGDMTPVDARVRKAAGVLLGELNSGGITATLGNGGTGVPSGTVFITVGRRHSLAAALERKEWFEKIRADTGVDIEQQIKRAEELSSSREPAELLKRWSAEDKTESKRK